MKTILRTILRYKWHLAVVAGALLLYLAAGLQSREVRMAPVERGPITEYVTEEAETQLDVERIVATERAGTMQRIRFEVGDEVHAGQVLASIEDTELALTLGSLRDQLQEVEGHLEGVDVPLPNPSERAAAEKKAERAAAELEQLQREREALVAELQYAEKDYARIQGLYERGSASDQQFDQAGKALQVARAALEALDRQIQAAGAGVAVARLQKQALDESMQDTAHLHKVYKAQLAHILKQIALLEHESKVLSPVDGIILEKYVDSTQFVQPGTRLASIGDLRSIEIRADILSDEVGRVAVGQQVLLVGDAIPQDSPAATATVQQIYPSGFTKISSLGVRQQRVAVIIDFDNSDLELGPGYELDVKIAVAHKDDALLVPADAVIALQEGSGVFVVEGGRARERKIQTGLKGEDYYEVVSGLEPGDTVIRRPPTSLEKDERVKPQKQEP